MINRVDCVYDVVLNVLSICIEFPCVLIQLGLGGGLFICASETSKEH